MEPQVKALGEQGLASCGRLPQFEAESDSVVKTHDIVKEMTEARLKDYSGKKKNRH